MWGLAQQKHTGSRGRKYQERGAKTSNLALISKEDVATYLTQSCIDTFYWCGFECSPVLLCEVTVYPHDNHGSLLLFLSFESNVATHSSNFYETWISCPRWQQSDIYQQERIRTGD